MKTVKYVLVMLMTAGLGIFASCSDNENSCTPLSITRISTVTDREQGLEVANLAQYIIVQGTGLDGVKSILVNDVPVDMSNAYTTANEITFPIPRVIPVEVNNLITLSTATESTTAPLSVFIPDLRVDGMYNEFTPAGGTMKIVGDFFDLYEITTESGQLNGYFENPDGTPITLNTDYLGVSRGDAPKAGPFENVVSGVQEIVVWRGHHKP